MKKLCVFLASLLLVGIQMVQAQTVRITGTVTSSEDGMPLPGVSVIVKGTTIGGATDANGKYEINVPANAQALTFSFIGFKVQDVAIAGRAIIDVALESESVQVQEVVVTAIGIKKAEKALGYAATSIGSDDIAKARESSVLNSLQGKVAGVVVSGGGGTPGASTKVILRGYSSLSGSNNPLYIVDGTPIDNGTAIGNGADFGNGANSINPDDVDNVTILKGAAATALYGSRAANGVIMITTKSGRNAKEKGLKVDFVSNVTFSNHLRLPQFQNVFGQGWSGHFAFEENGSWGPKLDGKDRLWGAVYNNSQQVKPFSALETNVADFYETGKSFTNTISLYGGDEKKNVYFSYSNNTEDGVVPTGADKMERNTFNAKGELKVNKFNFKTSANYITRSGSLPSDGRGGTNAAANLFSELLQIPRDISVVDHKDYKNNPFATEDYYFTYYAANPYYALSENANAYKDNRFFGNFEMTYEFFEGLKSTLRVGTDITNYSRRDWEAILRYTPGSYNNLAAKQENPGFYSENIGDRKEFYGDLLLQYEKKINEDFQLNVLGGYNLNERNGNSIYSEINSLEIPYWYNIKNSPNPATTTTAFYKRRSYSVFGQLDFSFRNFAFLSVVARNDWSSTLPEGNNSFFYPGVNTSIVLSDAIPDIKSILPYAKLRASWGKTGNDAGVYQIKSVFGQSEVFNPFGNLTFPINGVNAFEVGNVIGNSGLQPEISSEWELGADLRFFNSRLNFDIAYYNKATTDQIFTVPLANSTGYTTQTMNIGKITNKGIELMVSIIPVQTNNFEWKVVTTYTRNENKVEKLKEGLPQILLASAYDVEFVAKEGEPLGVFMGPVPETAPDGRLVVGADGMPLTKTTKGTYGNAQNKYIMGISNELKYKSLSFGFTLDIRHGGLIYSGTSDLHYFVGNATQTLYNDRQPFIIPNSVYGVQNPDGSWTYSENTTVIDMTNINAYYYHTKNKLGNRSRVFDRSYVKLREMYISYSIPKKFLAKMPVDKVEVSAYGKNLLLWTPEENNFIDPEVSSWGNDLAGDFGEFRANPTIRSFGLSLKASF